jgi:mannosyltransferase
VAEEKHYETGKELENGGGGQPASAYLNRPTLITYLFNTGLAVKLSEKLQRNVSITKGKFLLLLLISFTGLFLRIYHLSKESIWADEAESIIFAHLSVSEIFFVKSMTPPLYYIILHWWIGMFGDSDFSVRFPSVLFGFLSLLMIYKIANQLFKNASLFSVFLLALSLFHIRYSQEARTYSLSSLLTLLSMYFFIKLINKESLSYVGWYILFSLLLLYSHIYGLFIVLSQNIYYGILFFVSRANCKLNPKKWFFIQAVCLILFLPWALLSPWVQMFAEHLIGGVETGFWVPKPTRYDLIMLFSEYSQNSYLILLIFVISASLTLIKICTISGKLDWSNIFESMEDFRWRICLSNTDKFLLLFIWLLSPIIIPFLISQFATPMLISRYTIIASLAFYLLAGNGMSNANNKYVKASSIILVPLLSLSPLEEYYTKYQKPQWRQIANYIDKNIKNGELLLLNIAPINEYAFHHYFSRRNDIIEKDLPWVDEGNIDELRETVNGYNRVWITSTHRQDKKNLITKTLSGNYKLAYHKEYNGINVYLFEKSG